MVQNWIERYGKEQENRGPITDIEIDGNLADIYSDKMFLCSLAYRPWDTTLKDQDFLFIS